MSFKVEMDRRARRMLGFDDDTLEVVWEEDATTGREGCCDVCYYDQAYWGLTVSVMRDYRTLASRGYGDMGSLMQDLDAVIL